MIFLSGKGDFRKTNRALERMIKGGIFDDLSYFGRMGVNALANATPKDTGATANAWSFDVRLGKNPEIMWFNSNTIRTGTPLVILLQYGHGTGTGGYVQGYDFINPAIRPIFDQIAIDVWEKVIQ